MFSPELISAHPWVTTAARPADPTDRENYRAAVAAGAPMWIGKGYGMATARTHLVCAFGARLQFSPSIALGELNAELQKLSQLVTELAGVA